MFSLQFSRWFTVSTLLALGLAVGVIINDRSEPQTQTSSVLRPEADQQRLRKLETDLAALSATRTAGENSHDDMDTRLAALRTEMTKLQQATANAPSAGEQAQPAAALDPVELDRADQERTQLLVSALEGAMQSEPADLTWSASAAAELSRSVTDPKTQVGELRCASTLCRLDVTHGSPEAEQAFFMQFTQINAFQNSEGFVQRQERADGSLATVMYITRAGYPLPGKDPS